MGSTPAATKKAAASKTAATPTGPTESVSTTPLEGMPAAPAKKTPKAEHLFVAWTGEIIGLENPPMEVIIRDLRVFGRKDQCTEFAVDQEPAWKWVQTAKGESVTDAILAKAGR